MVVLCGADVAPSNPETLTGQGAAQGAGPRPPPPQGPPDRQGPIIVAPSGAMTYRLDAPAEPHATGGTPTAAGVAGGDGPVLPHCRAPQGETPCTTTSSPMVPGARA